MPPGEQKDIIYITLTHIKYYTDYTPDDTWWNIWTFELWIASSFYSLKSFKLNPHLSAIFFVKKKTGRFSAFDRPSLCSRSPIPQICWWRRRSNLTRVTQHFTETMDQWGYRISGNGSHKQNGTNIYLFISSVFSNKNTGYVINLDVLYFYIKYSG